MVKTIESSNDEDYKLRILGPKTLAEASNLFVEANVCAEHHIDYFHHIRTRSLRDRGFLIAVYRLRKMLEVLEMHTAENKRKSIGRVQAGDIGSGNTKPQASKPKAAPPKRTRAPRSPARRTSRRR